MGWHPFICEVTLCLVPCRKSRRPRPFQLEDFATKKLKIHRLTEERFGLANGRKVLTEERPLTTMCFRRSTLHPWKEGLAILEQISGNTAKTEASVGGPGL